MFEANCGRDTDWWIELDGRRLARLTDPRWVDMFWWQYRIDLDGSEDDARPLVDNRDLWLRCKLTFRSVPFGIVANHAFCGGNGPQDGTVTMRALFVDIGEPTPWERVLLWWRRRSRTKAVLQPVP